MIRDMNYDASITIETEGNNRWEKMQIIIRVNIIIFHQQMQNITR